MALQRCKQGPKALSGLQVEVSLNIKDLGPWSSKHFWGSLPAPVVLLPRKRVAAGQWAA